MQRWLMLFALAALLTACGGASPITAQQVFDRLEAAGLATNARPPYIPSGVKPPCLDGVTFDIPGQPGHPGDIVICPQAVGDSVMARPTSRPVGGVNLTLHHFRSAGGSVLVIVDSFVPLDIVERIEREVQLIPE
jgi:hypothetical protein